MPVGVLAIQGDFEKHLDALARVGMEGVEVRSPEHLSKVERLILPGGESTTVGLLLQRYGLGEAIQDAAKRGMPMWGTCMGMILMARSIQGRENQYRLNLLDIEVARNAFGAQVHSFEDEVEIADLEEPVLGVFIRAPVVTQCGEGVRPLGQFQGKVVAVRQGALMGTSFHPELTDDTRLHSYFLEIEPTPVDSHG
ncbi:MAG TPA: pyridoxal 5'-phosphate synthase glutaminase subunit PdxT [Fimbriimonas sp.]|nr:pyridoxal 5'-phosphate synthase glutaminase subunit PdxT [Fimbriimonas sp.]